MKIGKWHPVSTRIGVEGGNRMELLDAVRERLIEATGSAYIEVQDAQARSAYRILPSHLWGWVKPTLIHVDGTPAAGAPARS